MAPPKKPWFRMYCEVTGDRKLRSIPLDQRWVWVAVMTLARTSPIAGFLMVSEQLPCSDEAIADEAAAPLAKTRAALRLMEQLDMIHRDPNLGCWAVTNWARRQFESDDVTARTRKHRQQADETAMERSGNVDGTHQSSEAEAETEGKDSQQQQQSDGADPRLAAALDLHTAYRTAQGDVHSPPKLRSKLWSDHAAAMRTFLRLHPDCTHIDLAVEVLGMERPRPQLVPQAPCINPECAGGHLPSDPFSDDPARHTSAIRCPDCNPLARASGGSQ